MAVPKLRFKEFDGDWSQSRIGEIFQVTSGSTPLRSDNRFFENADIAWVKTTDLNNGLIEKTEEKISQIALKETSVKILPKGTVFVAMYGGFNQIGRTGLLVDEAACNQALSAIYPNEKIESYFLLTFLNHKVDDWKNFAASSRKDPNITKSDVLAFPLTYPVKEEQTKIASFLSTVDEKISQLTQKHALLSQYKQGMMQKLFSQQVRFKADDKSEFEEWEEKELKDIAEINPKSKKLPESFIYIDLESVEKGQLLLQKNIELQDAPSRAQRLLAKGDVLFQMVRPYQQNNYYFNLSGEYVASTGYAQIRTKLDSKFIYYALHEKTFLDEVMNRCTGTSYPAINSSDLSSIEILIPCLEEQTKIANFLSAIDQKIEVVAQQIEQAKQWKKGLLQQMFV
ncbi:restriction endonuclease subunit S [Acinetobacter tianfuensis]|uniref:Restriction endonuclease subunit S n=1 Tax=Acinetobacter tianfuensis TaxID=2419603 RepID=A0A3A8EJK6_9GAMM|nr:restriction endonuclease subunit S [Acinetobacter tianfuensis]RKG29081.1 restriction endonuclease subunit S [Acinetobacter tianfuensis]